MGDSMNQEWIDGERAKLKAEQDNAIGLANQCAGAMKILAALEAQLKAPTQELAPPLVPEPAPNAE